jgi:hypothetical protein
VLKHVPNFLILIVNRSIRLTPSIMFCFLISSFIVLSLVRAAWLAESLKSLLINSTTDLYIPRIASFGFVFLPGVAFLLGVVLDFSLLDFFLGFFFLGLLLNLTSGKLSCLFYNFTLSMYVCGRPNCLVAVLTPKLAVSIK